MAKLWLEKVRALFHFILSLRIDMKKRVYQNFDTPSYNQSLNLSFKCIFFFVVNQNLFFNVNDIILHPYILLQR